MVHRVEAQQVSKQVDEVRRSYRQQLELNIFVAVVFLGSLAGAGWILP